LPWHAGVVLESDIGCHSLSRKERFVMASVWIFQDPKQVAKYGEANAGWRVGFYDPGGKRKSKGCGPGKQGRRLAAKLAEKIKAQLVTGTYQSNEKATWEEFRKEFESKELPAKAPRTREETVYALDHFERIIKPQRMTSITSKTLADFVAKRRKGEGQSAGTTLAAATINKELRHLRAVLRKAYRWGYLPRIPDIDFLKEPKKLPTYVTPEHFTQLYQACENAARYPKNQPYPAADWWRAILVFGYLTGWRIGAILRLKREDVDLDQGFALSRYADNKGKRDAKVPLHPLIVEHLRKLAGFSERMFPWPLGERRVFTELHRVQEQASIRPEGGKDFYGFHDLRRAFATMNAERLTPDALQHLMQHQDYQTTQRYIAIARQMNPAVANLFVPDLAAKPKAAEA
jgi:integrase